MHLQPIHPVHDFDYIVRLAYKQFSKPWRAKSIMQMAHLMLSYVQQPEYTLNLGIVGKTPVGFTMTGPTNGIEKEIYIQALADRKPEITFENNHRNLCIISIAPVHQNKGLGKALLELVIKEESKYAQQLFSCAWRGNGDASYRLHQSAGFIELATYDLMYADGSSGTCFLKNLP